MEVTLGMTATVCIFVFFASFVDAIAGGGGLISLPAYMLVGLPPVIASGTNKFTSSFGTLFAMLKYLKKGKILLKAGIAAALGALPGAYLGAETLKLLPEGVTRIMLLIIIPLAAFVMIVRKDVNNTVSSSVSNADVAKCALIGLTIGFYDGLIGPGTGTFLIMLFTYFIGMDLMTASGSAKLVNLASNVAALTSLLIGGKVLFAIGVPAMIASIIGGSLGASVAIKKGTKMIRLMMMVVLCIMLVKLIIDWVG